MRDELRVTRELLEQYLEAQKSAGLSDSSIVSYRHKLEQLYALLPEDKCIRPGTIRTAADHLLEKGYSPNTVNVFLAAADGLVIHCGQPDLKSLSRFEIEDRAQPELSRQEYLWLLSAARTLGKAKAYYLIKCYVTLGITPQELSILTVEAVNRGGIVTDSGINPIPRSLCAELRAYAEQEGILSGPIFRGRNGKPLHRTSTNNLIAAVQQNTGIPAERCTPRSMRRLYLRTREELERRQRMLMEQEYERMLTEENSLTGWEPKRAARRAERFAKAGL